MKKLTHKQILDILAKLEFREVITLGIWKVPDAIQSLGYWRMQGILAFQ